MAYLRFMMYKLACVLAEECKALSAPQYKSYMDHMLSQQKETVWQINRLESRLNNRYKSRVNQELDRETASLLEQAQQLSLRSQPPTQPQAKPRTPAHSRESQSVNVPSQFSSRPRGDAPRTLSTTPPRPTPAGAESSGLRQERRQARPFSGEINVATLIEADIEPRPLYIATCLSDLEDNTELFDDKEIKERIGAARHFPTGAYPQLIQEAQEKYHHAIDLYSDGDQEMSYIYLSQFIQMVLMLMESGEFKRHISSYRIAYDRLIKSKDEAVKLKMNLRGKLMTRFTRLQTINPEELVDQLGANVDQDPLHEQDDEDAINGAVAPLSGLYFLLIDCRYSRDFEESHVTIPRSEGNLELRVINVPVHDGEACITLQDLLDRHEGQVRKELEAIHAAKRIVLMDWDSESLFPGAPITLLFRAFADMQWIDGQHQASTVIVKGGFRKWFVKYPQYTTNQQVNCRSFEQEGLCPYQDECPFRHLEQCPICKKLCIDPNDRRARNEHIAVSSSFASLSSFVVNCLMTCQFS